MIFDTFKRWGGLPEIFLALLMLGGMWAFYGFPYYLEAALAAIVLGCIGGLLWKRS